MLSLAPDFRFPWMAVGTLPQNISEFVEQARAERRPLCAVHSGGRLPTKRRPLQRFQALLDAFFPENGIAVIVVSAIGRRVVTIFELGDPAWFAPYPNEGRVVASNACPFRSCVDRCEQSSILCLETLSNDLVEISLKTAIFPPDARGLPSISPQ